MSYQVLARKWRPRRFSEMVGQSHVVRALDNALATGRLHHAYLFTGTRGVGKTTVARILAKGLNCEQGVTAEPCGTCSACVQLDEGRFVDLIEVDAASRAKVDETRDLMDNVQYAPAVGRFKVYLIDEVHMFSKHSFNALLKTLEEPPPHVKFLLATTDPQKLPVTVLSRCLQFHLRQLPAPLIAEHLDRLAIAEGIDTEPPALRTLAHAARGSVRDALSLMDQAIAFGAGTIRDADVQDMLGVVDPEGVWALIEALCDGDGVALLETIERLSGSAPDYDALLGDLLRALQTLAVAQTVPEAPLSEDAPVARVEALLEKAVAEDVQLWYQIGIMGRRDLPYAVSGRSGLEMTLLRMLAFRIAAPPENTSSPGSESSSYGSPGSKLTPSKSTPSKSTPSDGDRGARGATGADAGTPVESGAETNRTRDPAGATNMTGGARQAGETGAAGAAASRAALEAARASARRAKTPARPPARTPAPILAHTPANRQPSGGVDSGSGNRSDAGTGNGIGMGNGMGNDAGNEAKGDGNVPPAACAVEQSVERPTSADPVRAQLHAGGMNSAGTQAPHTNGSGSGLSLNREDSLYPARSAPSANSAQSAAAASGRGADRAASATDAARMSSHGPVDTNAVAPLVGPRDAELDAMADAGRYDLDDDDDFGLTMRDSLSAVSMSGAKTTPSSRTVPLPRSSGGASAPSAILSASASVRQSAAPVSTSTGVAETPATPTHFVAEPALVIAEPAPVIAEPAPDVAKSAPVVAEPALVVVDGPPVSLDDWAQAVTELSLSGLSRELAFNCELVKHQGDTVWLRVGPAHAQLRASRAEATLRATLLNRVPDLARVEFEVAAREGETPAERRDRQLNERRVQAAADLKADPTVAALGSYFGATVDPSRVQPSAVDVVASPSAAGDTPG